MVEEEDKQSHHKASGQQFDFTFYILHKKDVPRFYNFLYVKSIICVLITRVGLDFKLGLLTWTLDLDLDLDLLGLGLGL